jgi:hypothetical protein
MQSLTEHARLKFDAARHLFRPDPGRTSIIAHEMVQAFLVDLRHYCAARGIDFDRCNGTAAFIHERQRRGS